ncbi:MAG: hypothetical protein H3C62_17800 [Gemmatimonadaceae bacterium]|nr:hypothetical protein [Gemmatimonadaceae bacterium]
MPKKTLLGLGKVTVCGNVGFFTLEGGAPGVYCMGCDTITEAHECPSCKGAITWDRYEIQLGKTLANSAKNVLTCLGILFLLALLAAVFGR